MTTQHLSFISLRVVRMLFLMFTCIVFSSCEESTASPPREKSPQELVTIIKNGGPEQAESAQRLLSMSGEKAGQAQEEAGDFFELEAYEEAEKFWEAARRNGRPEAGPKYSLIWRLICTHPWWTLLIIGGFIVSFIMYISSKLDKQEKKRAQEEQERQQRERQERQQELVRKNREAQQQVLQSAWWNLPNGSILVLDTCVLMADENEMPGLGDWLNWIANNAEQKQWRIHIIKPVYQEILKHKANGNDNERYGARNAIRRIEAMQKKAEACVDVGCEGKRTDSTYADDPLRGYICHNDKTILFTKDRDLGIRVRNARCGKQVRTHDDFKPYPGKPIL